MKVALVQMNVIAGNCKGNVEKMKVWVDEAKQANCDLIIFPQNAVSGYVLGDKWLDQAWCQEVDGYNNKIMQWSDEIAIVWGNVKYRHGHLFNCAFFAYQGQTHMRVKRNETGGYANDARYFEENAIHDLIEYKDHLFSLQFHHDYMLADWAINLDTDYVRFEQEHWKPKGNTLYVNPIGMQTSGKHVMVYRGGSFVYQDKEVKQYANDGEEELLIVELDKPIEKKIGKQFDVYEAMCFGIREFDKQILGGNMPWIVGLSGGLDSSVTAALLTGALGNARIYGYNMATAHNTIKTIDNAKHLAKALGIHYAEGEITPLVDASIEVANAYGYDEANWKSLVKENIQARIRGHLLSTFASIHGGVVVNNGNKVELALGYCTLYGDAIGAVSLLGDLSKVSLFTLSRLINEHFGKEVIPKRLLPEFINDEINWEVPPSAELADGQFDPMKWFYHDYLIDHRKTLSITELMQRYLDGSIKEHALYQWIKYYGLDDPQAFVKDLDWFTTTMKRNGFKQVQVPPLFVMSDCAFGEDLSQCQFDEIEYETLKKAILEVKSYDN